MSTSAKTDKESPYRTPNERPVTIRADRLSKIYGQFAALHEVSFEVRKGTVAAFLGPNGAGKSTTMKILTGFSSPTSGSAEVLGLNPSDADKRIELARRLGYLPESGPLYRGMTPAESLGFVGQLRKLDKVQPKIDKVVEQCAIGEVLHKPIDKLSKGFRQRVGMAQALLHDPEVLIFDEPTSGLDPLQIREVRELIRELGREKTILLSTHILQEVEAVANDVVFVYNGKIVFAGPKDELRKDSTLDEQFYALTEGKKKGAA